MTVLSTTGLSVSFGGVRALVDVDVQVHPGELVGLIGPNGAGKTTFIDAITGFVPCVGGVELAGEDISRDPPHTRARKGLVRTWQSIEMFDELSVRQNLAVAASQPPFLEIAREVLSGPRPTDDRVAETLELLDLAADADRFPDELSQGRRKLVGVGRAIVQRPQLLLLDEPGAGLDTTESLELGRRLRAVVDAGTPMLLIDHDMGLVLSICDRLVVLDFGKVIADGDPTTVGRDPAVIQAYLGSSAKQLAAEIEEEVKESVEADR